MKKESEKKKEERKTDFLSISFTEETQGTVVCLLVFFLILIYFILFY